MNDYRIRRADGHDLEIVLHHRRRMFEDMGFTDPGALDTMIAVSRPLIGDGLKDGSYAGWLIESSNGVVVAGAGVFTLKFQPHPIDPRPRRAWVVNTRPGAVPELRLPSHQRDAAGAVTLPFS